MSSLPTDTRETRKGASEVKFLIDPVVGANVRDWARERFAPDPNGSGPFGDQYRTTSVYLDTDALDVYHRRGSYGRSKYRVRRYDDADVVFLERKLKTARSLVKWRTAVPIAAIPQLEAPTSQAGSSGRWFERRLAARKLRARCQVSYRRTAFVAATSQGPARLTLDDHLFARPTRDVAFGTDAELPILENQMILELKFSSVMPGIFKQLVEQFVLTPGSVSKYRIAAGVLNLEWERPAQPQLATA